MNNIKISDSETIFEPFWDTGESYPGHQKYSRLTPYTVTTGKNSIAKARDGWCSVLIDISKQGENEDAITMERDCILDISAFDTLKIHMCLTQNDNMKIYCVIDGEECLVIDAVGTNRAQRYCGEISGKIVTHIKICLRHLTAGGTSAASLFYMGLENRALTENQAVMSHFSPEWEGCFKEKFDIEPEVGIFFDGGELESLRRKLKKEPYKRIYEEMKDNVSEYMGSNPEEEIEDYFPCESNQFGEGYEHKRIQLITGMELLAFVGIIENDKKILKMACRFALSAACSRYWCEHAMGEFPGATWHHRSFTEYKVANACALVLDWAGSLLTWHGKNIIYDAIIMKGLPRIEADFKTMDYIYECNQGFMFNRGRVAALLVLSKRYPRYKKMLDESEEMMMEMLEQTIQPDGSSLEGPSYWGAVIQCVMPTIYMFARYRKTDISQYVTEKFKKFVDYGLVVMSDWGDRFRFVPICDTPPGSRDYTDVNIYTAVSCSLVSDDPAWREIINREKEPFLIYQKTDYLIMGGDVEEPDKDFSFDGFRTMNYSGLTSLRRTAEDIGASHILISGGKTCFSHCHGDKGSFVLEIDGTPIFVDGGTCGYGDPQSELLRMASAHNLLVPIDENGVYSDQPKYCYGGKIKKASYENGDFEYETDVTEAWEDDIFKKNIRRIESSDSHVYTITDDIEFKNPMAADIIFNSYIRPEYVNGRYELRNGNKIIAVRPINYSPKWEVVNAGYGGALDDDMNFKTLWRLKLHLEKGRTGKYITDIEINMIN